MNELQKNANYFLTKRYTEGDEDDEEEKKAGKMNGIEDNETKGGKKPDANDDEDFSDDEDDDDDDDDDFETMLDSFGTCIDENDEVDEFVAFRDTLQGIYIYPPQSQFTCRHQQYRSLFINSLKLWKQAMPISIEPSPLLSRQSKSPPFKTSSPLPTIDKLKKVSPRTYLLKEHTNLNAT